MNEFDKKEIIELTKKLVSYKTTASNVIELELCASYIKDYFSSDEFSIREYVSSQKPTLIITSSGSLEPEVFLHAHFDVVPAVDDQFTLIEKGVRLYGRGVLDMKAQVAALMVLYKSLHSQVRSKVGLIFVSDEEVGGYDGVKHLLTEKIMAPEFVISAEPSDLRIANEAKGILNVELIAKGKSAHSSRPWQGENAITKLSSAIESLVEKYPIPSEADNNKFTTYSVSTIEGGDGMNKVPDYAKALVNIRYLPEETPQQIVAGLVAQLGDGVAVGPVFVEPAAHCDPVNRYVQGLSKSIEAVLGKAPELVRKSAGSDIRHFTAKGIPGVVFGPSGGGSAHSDTEWIDLGSLWKFYEVIEYFCLHFKREY